MTGTDHTTTAEWAAVAAGSHHAPHDLLGAHSAKDAAGRASTTIRARRPLADSVVAVLKNGTRVPLEHAADGIWQGEHLGAPVPYRLETVYDGGAEHVTGDPYRHLPSIGDLDLHLIGEGRHERLWEVLGANAHLMDGDIGVAFAVWAPNAECTTTGTAPPTACARWGRAASGSCSSRV
jgi:1,4-alpha-glucan branching enzyme